MKELCFPLFAAVLLLQPSDGLSQNPEAPMPPVETRKEAPNPESPKPETTAPADSKPEAPKTYVVKSGDNPWLIAKNHGISLEELLKVNQIKDPKNLKVGDELVLPAGTASQNQPVSEKKEEEATQNSPAAPREGDDWELYTVQAGDNPWAIAKKLKLDHQKIVQLNKGLDFSKLRIGQQIKIPKKKQ